MSVTAFRLSRRSEQRLQGVHRDLVRVVRHAIEITEIDFGVTQGLRTIEQQRVYVATGASTTMDSRHLTGHAVDVAAYIGRELRWDFGLYYKIAEAFRTAGSYERVPIRWGACWMRIDNTDEPLHQMVARYTASARAKGRRPLIDGPHFELPKTHYP